MKVTLTQIEPPASPTRSEAAGTVVQYTVMLAVNDEGPRAFLVTVQGNLRPGFDASLLRGEPLLEELLRFEPEALAKLLSHVGRFRRGQPTTLPLVLVDASERAA